MGGGGEVQFGVPTDCSGSIVLVCRRRPIWSLGPLRTAQRVVGQLCAIRGLYGKAQLVFAGVDNPGAGEHLYGGGDSVRSSPCSGLENSHHCFAKRSSSDRLCTGDDGGFGSQGTSQFLGFFGRGGSAALGRVCRFPAEPRRFTPAQ